jgi:hypothetical protein
MKRILLALLAYTLPALAQISPRPADLILPVVGSTRGQSNANFKTELQMTNPTGSVMGGWLVYRPHGLFLRYEIPAGATLSFADVIAAMGGSGLGSLDVLADRGAIPTIVARAYDDQPAGTTGVTVPAVPTSAVLVRDDVAALIVPRDLTRFRFNAGVRALGSGALLQLTVRSANGTVRHQRQLAFDADAFQQQSGSSFAGIALLPDDSIAIRVAEGSAIVYATTVDNVTNDSSIQLLRK